MQICKRFKVKFVESNIMIIIAIYKKLICGNVMQNNF